MKTPPLVHIITLDGASGEAERAYLAIHYCTRCQHHWDHHGMKGAIPPSRSRCQVDGCECARFVVAD